jgi:hypothetical protein
MERKRILWALAVLNVVLLIVLVLRIDTPRAFGQAGRRPADYLMLPGAISGASNAWVYVLDLSNGQLGAMVYDEANRGQLKKMPSIDLNRVFENAGGVVGGGNKAKGK